MSRPIRFTFIIVLAALATGLAAVGGWRYAKASAPVSGPIIVVSVDTLRADRLPVYGYTKLATPAIDALAADGVVFDRVYSHASQTLPAHASLLSGRLPFETGVRDNVGFSIRPGERLLPEMLRDRGYSTAGVVSAFVLRKATGMGQGFAFFDDHMPEGKDFPALALERDGADSLRIAEQWLESVDTTRAFLFLHLYEPHKPYTPPERYGQYEPYDGEIAYTDELIGRLTRFLKDRQLYDQSTIFLVSDHGEGLGDHGEQEHGLFVYGEAIRVPLIVKPAAGGRGGRHVSDVVQHVDLVPTVLDLAKAPIPGNLRGRSLRPLIEGSGHLPDRTVYSESLYARYHLGWSELTSLTDGRYRYIRAPREELYDLVDDPGERDNASQSATLGETKAALRRELDKLTPPAEIPTAAAVSEEDRQKYEALGYVGSHPIDSAANRDDLTDPKDALSVLERYRDAVDLATARKWPEALEQLRALVQSQPDFSDGWERLASLCVRAGRYDQAIDAYRHLIAADPTAAVGHLRMARTLLTLRRLDDAQHHAEAAANLNQPDDSGSLVESQELLMRIALARGDRTAAREHAEMAQQAGPSEPWLAFVDARFLYDDGQYPEALAGFETALASLERDGVEPMADLHYYTAESLGQLERWSEAEHHFVEELRTFPLNSRARAGLALAYYRAGRLDEAGDVLADMLRIIPTPEAYGLAARTWTTLGDVDRAAAVRAEARRTFGNRAAPSASTHPAADQ